MYTRIEEESNQTMESLPNFEKWPLKYNDIIENGVMKFNGAFCLPSLQYISSIHLVIHFWCKHLKDFEYQLAEVTWCEVCRLGNEVVRELDDIIKPKCLGDNIPHLVLLIGSEIWNWVKFYDYHVFKKQYNKKGIAVKYVDKIVWLPRGSINHLETAKAMLTVTKSLPRKGCSILCNACANSDINLIGYPAFKWKIEMYDSGWRNCIQRCFWLDIMHRSKEEFKKMQCMYCFEHEVSRFLGDTPVNEYNENIKGLLSCFTIDYSCYVFSKLDISQQNTLIKNGAFCYDVMSQFLKEPFYLDYFLPVLYFAKNFIAKSMVCQLLFYLDELIANHDYKCLHGKYVFIFKELWSFLPEDMKDYFLSFEIKMFDWLWQCDYISMLSTFFAHSQPSFRRMFSFNSRALNFCNNLIKYGEWEMFEQYICPVFFNSQDEETISLKCQFVHEMKDLFWYFIKHKLWKDLNRFFSWCYKDETKQMEQKKILLKDMFIYEVNDFKFISKMHYKTKYRSNSNSNGVTDFTRYDDLLRWCFRTRREMVDFKQTELCKTSKFTDFIRDMIKLKRLDIIERFLSWCFSNNKLLIEKYKENFLNELTALEKYIASHPKRRRLR